MKKRFKNKLFLTAIAVFLYQLLLEFEVAPEISMYQQAIDLVCYAVMGFGIYSTFEEKGE